MRIGEFARRPDRVGQDRVAALAERGRVDVVTRIGVVKFIQARLMMRDEGEA